jgi:peptide deformylase
VTIRDVRVDPVLRTPADPVRDFDARLAALVADLEQTVALPGRAGLAAPQIGVGLRVFAYDVDDRRGHVVNPVVVAVEGQQDGDEGCLSLPGLWCPTRRPATVTVIGTDVHGHPVTVTGSDLLARCLVHETDHLDGVLFLDRLDPADRRVAMRTLRQQPLPVGDRVGGDPLRPRQPSAAQRSRSSTR